MGIAGLFNRRPDPANWTELWDVLTPLGGRTGPQDVTRLSDSLKAHPDKKRRAAQKQLAEAMGLLDTEENARNLRRDAWRGPGTAFRRGGFLAVIQSVIAAGPESINRVLDQPMHLAGYDTAMPDLDERVRAEYHPATPMDALAVANSPWFGGPTARIPKKKAWPSLNTKAFASYDFDAHDPEVVWLSIDSGLLIEEDDARSEEQLAQWEEAEIAATSAIMSALGEQNPPNLASPPVYEIGIEFMRGPVAHADMSEEVEEGDEYDEEDGELLISRLVDSALVDAARTHEERSHLLVQQVARALLSADVGWSTARAPLETLARPAGS